MRLALLLFAGILPAACAKNPDLPSEAAVAPAPAPAEAAPAAQDPVFAAIDAPDRSEADRALDAGRHPAEVMKFIGIQPGMRVAELGAGGGYTAELLARIVGPTGVVYGQNSAFILERFAEKPWSERLQKPAMANVVRVDREFDAPLPPEATELDVVLNNLFYHDTVWLGTDRDAMNRAIYAALRPGGLYVVIDHSAAPGAGLAAVKDLHRIEERLVREEIERAGFVLARSSDLLRNPEDTRDWNASPSSAAERRGTSDRFFLVFQKP